jgi:cell division protein YceG involved in septum cleavage
MKKLLAFVLLLGLVAAGAASAWFYQGIRRPFRGYLAPEQFVDIPPGLRARAIGERLVAAGVVRDVVTFRAAMWTADDHAGEGASIPSRIR